MSLILEALRKSEAERRRGLAPDVAMELPPTLATRPRTPQAWLLPVLVVAALLVLAGWWTRRDPAKAAPPETVSETTINTPATTDPIQTVMPRIQPQPVAPTMARVPAPAATSTPPTNAAPESMATPTPSIQASRSAPVRPIPTPPAPARSSSPRASDISNDFSSLPPIKLSMLMWDEVPSKRFVIINGQRMAEGDHSGEMTVIAIERNGVVVESNGSRARVPLP